jgi:hypothetical protein
LGIVCSDHGLNPQHEKLCQHGTLLCEPQIRLAVEVGSSTL